MVSFTQAILQEYFKLSVELAGNYLCPTVPNRLNYICWVKDLLDSLVNLPGTVTGVDIGVGASAIYPLLGHTQYGWHFIGN